MTSHLTTETRDQEFHESLRRRGYRLTGQRLAILSILREGAGTSTADEIYQRARQLNPNINLATVYRTLNVFREMGLVEQSYASPEHSEACFSLSLSEGFGAASEDEEDALPFSQDDGPRKRFHFRCLGCGQIIQFQGTAIVEALSSTLAGNQVQFDQICMCVQGYCPQCAKASSR